MSTADLDNKRNSLTILVVDDSTVERNLVVDLFQRRGFRVLSAENGAEALLMLASERPDAIVSDGQMPILDGYQLCRLLKDDPLTRHLPVVLLTGQAGGLSRFWARTCGADCFLLKGRELLEVVDVVQDLISTAKKVPSATEARCFDVRELGIDAIQQRLGKALEHRLLETAMRDTIGHLFALHRDTAEMTKNALVLLHDLVLPGAIYMVIQHDGSPLGIGLHGPAVNPGERAAMEASAHQTLGEARPWPSLWEEVPPLQEKSSELHEPAIFCVPEGVPSGPAPTCMIIFMGQKAFHDHERIFGVAWYELNRVLDLAESHEKLVKAEQAVREAQKIESLVQMSDGVAHNFNNLFQSILTSLELTRFGTIDERGKGILAEAERAVKKGAVIARQMLEYSGHVWCQKSPMDVNALVRELVDAQPELPCTLQLAENLPLVEGDQKHLKQVLGHLLTNATEAIGTGSGKITIATSLVGAWNAATRAEGRWITDFPSDQAVCLSISDNGCGASEDVLARMFDPFFSTKQFGRGMGLPVTLGVVKAHQAALQVVSRLGEGTSFKLWFPILPSQGRGPQRES